MTVAYALKSWEGARQETHKAETPTDGIPWPKERSKMARRNNNLDLWWVLGGGGDGARGSKGIGFWRNGNVVVDCDRDFPRTLVFSPGWKLFAGGETLLFLASRGKGNPAQGKLKCRKILPGTSRSLQAAFLGDENKDLDRVENAGRDAEMLKMCEREKKPRKGPSGSSVLQSRILKIDGPSACPGQQARVDHWPWRVGEKGKSTKVHQQGYLPAMPKSKSQPRERSTFPLKHGYTNGNQQTGYFPAKTQRRHE
ncbi:hypothetical protein MKZ38_003044 [Zalerion maritima]|uniref:Uncharacterized protein n=1 Tax=Zalerion maritima TaxID=339359 RepID=A0AAD5RN29_9PEZI|nr:hypothetical protein MKZ38_003044 [Zalerion maritima]